MKLRRSLATRVLPITVALAVPVAMAFVACSSSSSPVTADAAAADATAALNPSSTPLAGSSLSVFLAGEGEFFRTLSDKDGLGPLYTKTSCGECHQAVARGPGAAIKMAVVNADGLTPSPDQSLLAFGNTEHPLVVTSIPNARTPILPPFDGGVDGGSEGVVSIRVTTRLGPGLYGRGYMEAIADSEIERMETEESTRTDGIHGRVNHLSFVSQPNPDPTFDSNQQGQNVIGRFGLKARIATLDEFAADALQGDMGITSPMRPSEFSNPDGVTDDLKPGIDVTADEMNARSMYLRLLAIPPRTPDDAGKSWFETCACNACHVESLHTRSDYPIPQLANIDAPIYSDMLLHDMGDGLSDSVEGGNEGAAGPRDWRTLPLMGERFNTSFLHDGRASTISDAIMMHESAGSEANNAVLCFKTTLSPVSRQTVVDFVNGL